MLVDPAIVTIGSINPAKAGHIGGLGLPILVSWGVGGIFAAGAAYVIGKASLGLRSDYLAIATLGISEIVVYVLKNEDWLARGVKNVNGLPRPVPYEVDLQTQPWPIDMAATLGTDIAELSLLSSSFVMQAYLLSYWQFYSGYLKCVALSMGADDARYPR